MNEPLSPQAVTAAVLAVAPRVGAVETAQPLKTAEPLPETAQTTAKEPLRDRAGREFDPKRFRTLPDGSPFVNAKGLFMPRGGRRAKPADAPSPTSPPVASVSTVPVADPWTAADRAAAAPPPVTQTGEAETSEQPPGAPPPVGSSSDAAEVGCRAAYTLAGMLVGAPKQAVPPTAEHKNYVETAAKYIDYRGWRFVGGLALALMGLAYVLRLISLPEVKESLRKKYGWGEPEPKNVTPAPEGEQEPKREAAPPAAVPPIIPQVNEPVQFTKPFVPPMP